MRTIHRVVLLTTLATFASALTACSNFDLDKLDVFGLNEKKKLPGERKDVFPGGVPGRYARNSAGICEGQSAAA